MKLKAVAVAAFIFILQNGLAAYPCERVLTESIDPFSGAKIWHTQLADPTDKTLNLMQSSANGQTLYVGQDILREGPSWLLQFENGGYIARQSEDAKGRYSPLPAPVISADASVVITRNLEAPFALEAWNARTGKRLSQIESTPTAERDAQVYNFSLSQDGRIVAFRRGQSDRIFLADTRTGKLLNSTVITSRSGILPSFSPDGRWLLAPQLSVLPAGPSAKIPNAERRGKVVNKISLLEVATGKSLQAGLTLHDFELDKTVNEGTLKEYQHAFDDEFGVGRGTAFSPDSRFLAYSTNFGEMAIVDLSNGQTVYQESAPKNKRIRQLSFSRNSRQLFVSSAQGLSLLTFDSATDTFNKRVIHSFADTEYFQAMGISPSGRLLAIQIMNNKSEYSLYVFEVSSAALKSSFPMKPHVLQNLVFSEDETQLRGVPMYCDYGVLAWDLRQSPVVESWLGAPSFLESNDPQYRGSTSFFNDGSGGVSVVKNGSVYVWKY